MMESEMPKPDTDLPYLAWSDRFTVGVDVLDRDHRALVEMINNICMAAQVEDGQAALDALDQLQALAREHFHREEEVLKTLPSYKRLPAPAREHASRVRQLDTLRQHFEEAGGSRTRLELCEELIHWFVRQSIGHDAEIKGYFDDRRPEAATG